jgi:hypothetical protein
VKTPCIAGHHFFTASLQRNKDQVLDGVSAKNASVVGDFCGCDAELASQAEKICGSASAQLAENFTASASAEP